MGLGDAAMIVLDKILINNVDFSQLDISKNYVSNSGIKVIANCLKYCNNSLVHINIGGNNIQPEGAQYFFRSLYDHPSLVSLDMANNDCFNNKLKIGCKGAESLCNMLKSPNCLISHLDLTDNALTVDALNLILEGARVCMNLISLNLTQNDIGLNNPTYAHLLTLLKSSKTLLELNLA